MSLDNLVGRTLERVAPERAGIARMLAAAERNLADARLAALSAENRFDAAYKAIMQCAMLALRANGFRTLTSQAGHHQTALQTLPLTIGLGKGQDDPLGRPEKTAQPRRLRRRSGNGESNSGCG